MNTGRDSTRGARPHLCSRVSFILKTPFGQVHIVGTLGLDEA